MLVVAFPTAEMTTAVGMPFYGPVDGLIQKSVCTLIAPTNFAAGLRRVGGNISIQLATATPPPISSTCHAHCPCCSKVMHRQVPSRSRRCSTSQQPAAAAHAAQALLLAVATQHSAPVHRETDLLEFGQSTYFQLFLSSRQFAA